MNFRIYILAVLVPIWGFSQSDPPERIVNDQVQFWTSVNSTIRVSQRWGIIADAHIRRNDFVKEPNFYFTRLGGAFWIDDAFSVAGGGALLWLATDTEVGSEYALEKRTYQQFLWREKISRLTFLQRIRIEQRWHEVLDPSDASVDRIRYTNRFRFLMSATIKVFENNYLPKPVIANEIHFHLGEEVIYNTFEQNRIFLGINQRLSPIWSFDFGYMLVYQQKYSGVNYDLNHTLRWFFYYTPDFRKEKNKELPNYPMNGFQ